MSERSKSEKIRKQSQELAARLASSSGLTFRIFSDFERSDIRKHFQCYSIRAMIANPEISQIFSANRKAINLDVPVRSSLL